MRYQVLIVNIEIQVGRNKCMFNIGQVVFDTYKIQREISSNQDGILRYEVKDLKKNKELIVKAFKLPDKDPLKQFIRTLWNHEIRLTHKATSMVSGKSLLRVVDARPDETNNYLLLFTEKGDITLSECLEKRDNYPFLRPYHTHLHLWQGFLGLAKAISSLHQSGLLHRNLNPQCIYYNEKKQENSPLFVIGDFSWSIYLYGLIKIHGFSNATQMQRKMNLFLAPELLKPIKDSYESFCSDVFSLGMIFAYCFIPEIDEVEFDNFEGYNESLKKLFELIENAIHLEENEKCLIKGMINPNPSLRIQDCNHVHQEIENIIQDIDAYTIDTSDKPMPVNTYVEKLCEVMGRKTTYNVVSINKNPDSWLKEHFKGARVYLNKSEKSPLVIVCRDQSVFNLAPWYKRTTGESNDRVAKLYYRNYPFKIPSENPILILNGGLFYPDYPQRYSEKPSWSIYFARSRDSLKKQSGFMDENEKLIEQLYLTLDSQNMYDCRFVYPYNVIDSKDSQDDKKKILLIKVHGEFNHPKYGRIQNAHLSELEDMMIKENLFDCELSNNCNPYEDFSDGSRWTIEKFEKDILTLSRWKWSKGTSTTLLKKGYLRPWTYRYSASLFHRKKRALKSLKSNQYLQDSLLFPSVLSIYPESINTYRSNIVNRILFSHPMFLVQGPPGTGKTWLASNLIENILKLDPAARILVTAKDHEPLNHLMDVCGEKLLKSAIEPKPLMVRHLSYDKEQEVTKGESTTRYLLQNVLREKLLASIRKCKESDLDEDLKKRICSYFKDECSFPTRPMLNLFRKSSNVFFTTSTARVMNDLKIDSPPFDWVVIEEAGKGYPTELLIPMVLGHKWLLIGDQKQLPPYKHREISAVIDSYVTKEIDTFVDWSEEEFSEFREHLTEKVKFFDYIYNTYDKSKYLYLPTECTPPVERLEDQYRMPPTISDMISTIFYDTKFTHKKEAPNIGDPFVAPRQLSSHELIWINVPHGSQNRKSIEQGRYFNNYEVLIIKKLLEKLEPKEEFTDELVILSPYKEQVYQLKRGLKDVNSNLGEKDFSKRCHTVDSFQGRQADIVILSLVRNNIHEDMRKAVGFITSDERLNVMFSRVRKRMYIVGCIDHFQIFDDNTDMKSILGIIEYCKSNGQVVKAEDIGGM